MKDAVCITVVRLTVAASTGRLLQIAIARGRQRKELHCFVNTGI